jgi:hypothetical protein
MELGTPNGAVLTTVSPPSSPRLCSVQIHSIYLAALQAELHKGGAIQILKLPFPQQTVHYTHRGSLWRFKSFQAS